MPIIVYQFEEIPAEGITDLTLFTVKIDFDIEEPNPIVEELLSLKFTSSEL